MYMKYIDFKNLLHLVNNVSLFPHKYCTLTKLIPKLEEKINKQIVNDELKVHKHPGIIKHSCVELPDNIKRAISEVISDTPKKLLLNESKLFERYLHARQPPVEKNTLRVKLNAIKEEVENSINVDKATLDEDQLENFEKAIEYNIQNVVKQRIYNWQPINYTRYKGLQYLVARASAEYAVLTKIFNEIKKRANYAPTTIFDFGSGVGTVIWAAGEVWGDELKEVLCVDTSREMNSLSEDLNTLIDKSSKLKNKITYRQFLPASNPNYDVVVSAYSLMELPSSSARLQTVSKLWNKVTKYLILIEQGTLAGFKLIAEARDFILQTSGDNIPCGHIFSPCPHDFQCPRLSKASSLCNFEATHYPYSSQDQSKKEMYSYVVIDKDPRSMEDAQWPRIVRPVLKKSRHVICRMCTSSGSIQEITFTPTKHDRILYRCARSCNWGDKLPVSLELQTVEDSRVKKKRINRSGKSQ